MSFHSSSGMLEESSSVVYSSLDSCNSMISKNEEKSISDESVDKYYENGFPDTETSLMNRLNHEIYGKTDNMNDIPLPNISSITLEKIIEYEMISRVKIIMNNNNNNNNKLIIHLIMKYFHSMQYITVHFVTLNGLTNSNMSCLKLIMYKDDTITNLQKHIAIKHNVSSDHLILCEFWKSILTKLKYEKISMISPSDQIIAYYMPYYIEIKQTLFDNFKNDQLSYTSLVHQCHNFIDDDEQSLSSLNFQLFNHPYFDKTPTINGISSISKHKRNMSHSQTQTNQIMDEQTITISELSHDTQSHLNNTHFVIPPPTIDENDCLSEQDIDDEKYGQNINLQNILNLNHNQQYDENDIINVGIPIPLMLPKHSIISTSIIIKQCDMILSPYLKAWKNYKIKPYELYILSKNTIYCGICQDNAFCRGCKLNKYQEINTKDLHFIIGLRWIDEDSLNSFDQTVFTLNKSYDI